MIRLSLRKWIPLTSLSSPSLLPKGDGRNSMLLQRFGKSIGDGLEFEVVFQQCFETRKHPGKSTLRIKRILYHLISISLESRICNRDVCGVVLESSEDPLDRRHR